MKKKIVNVILSAAVVASMMFTVTACGSKDAGTSAPAPESTAAVDNADAADNADDDNAADNADDDNAESTAADDTNASGGSTAEEWASSDKAATYVQLFDAMFGGQMTTAFEADGDALALIVTLSEDMVDLDGASLTDEQKDAMQTAMQEQYDSTADQFATIRDELRKEIGDDSLTIRIVYELSDGTELFSQDL